MRTLTTRALSLAVLILIAGCGGDGPSTPTAPDQSNVPYSQTDLQVGSGPEAVAGKTIVVAYIGWLYSESGQDHKGTQFDSNAAGTFQIGVGSLIKGWDQGIPRHEGGRHPPPRSFRPIWPTGRQERGRSRRTPRSCSIFNCWPYSESGL